MVVSSADSMSSPVRVSDAFPDGRVCDVDEDACVIGVLSDVDNERVNAVGEGAVLVCDIAGPVACGDLLVSSVVPGFARRKRDAVVTSAVVGKVTVSFDFVNVPTYVPEGKRVPRTRVVRREAPVYQEVEEPAEKGLIVLDKTKGVYVQKRTAPRKRRVQVHDEVDLYDEDGVTVVGTHQVPRTAVQDVDEEVLDEHGDVVYEEVDPADREPTTRVFWVDARGEEVAEGAADALCRAALLPCVYYCG
jgi:hypothetical protein